MDRIKLNRCLQMQTDCFLIVYLSVLSIKFLHDALNQCDKNFENNTLGIYIPKIMQLILPQFINLESFAQANYNQKISILLHKKCTLASYGIRTVYVRKALKSVYHDKTLLNR